MGFAYPFTNRTPTQLGWRYDVILLIKRWATCRRLEARVEPMWHSLLALVDRALRRLDAEAEAEAAVQV